MTTDYAKQMKEKDPHGKNPHEPGAKCDAGKIQAGILGDFSRALSAIAEVGTHGAAKYTREGWCSVPCGIERYTDAKWRHLLASHHETHDPDSGFLHAAHEAWNALAVLELILREVDGHGEKLASLSADHAQAEEFLKFAADVARPVANPDAPLSGTAEFWRATALRLQEELKQARA